MACRVSAHGLVLGSRGSAWSRTHGRLRTSRRRRDAMAQGVADGDVFALSDSGSRRNHDISVGSTLDAA